MYDTSAMDIHTTLSGLRRHRLPVLFPPLNKHRFISSDTAQFAIHKAVLQEMLWKQQFEARAAIKRKKLGLEMNAKRKEITLRQRQKIAESRTEIARQELTAAYNALESILDKQLNFDWETLKRYPEYPEPRPAAPKLPDPPYKPNWPRQPQLTDPAYVPKLDPMDKLRRAKREEKEREAHARFEAAHRQWEQVCLRMRKVYQEQQQQHQLAVQRLQQQYENQARTWEEARDLYVREREQCIAVIEKKKAAYLEHEPHAVLDFFDMALSWSPYPPCFPHSFEMDYDERNRILLVDYLLPPLRVLPRLVKVSYNEKDNAFFESVLSDNERDTLYARLLHEIPLRTFHELFTIDTAVSLAAIHFRGYLFLAENKSQPKPPVCVLQIKADRGVFASIDLYHSDSVALFEELGGIIKPLE